MPGFSRCNLRRNLPFPATGPLQKVFAVIGLEEVIFLRFSLETARACNLRPNGFHVQPNDVKTVARRSTPWRASDF